LTIVIRRKAALWQRKANFCPQITSFRRRPALCDGHVTLTPSAEIEPAGMMIDTIKYLRETAQTCARLARTCPHVATSHGLEEVAVDMMNKAKELEREYGN
jgi:hypothetical protein